MTCVGNCTLCGFARDSRLCDCLSRVRSNDPIHEELQDAEDFIRETRFFGNDAKDEAFELILAGRQRVLADIANGKIFDGNILKKVDRDVETLKTRAKGKLFATAQKLSERPRKTAQQTDGLSNVERLQLRLNIQVRT